MKNRLFKLLIITLFINSFNSLSAQITIGSLDKPIKGALLEVKEESSTDINSETAKTGGILLPRVKLKDLKSLEPCVSESVADYAEQKILNAGLMVFNTTKEDTKSIYAGIYAWNGNEWQFMVSQASEFNLSVSPINIEIESGIDGQTIKSKSISASWRPVGSSCTVEEKSILNGGVSINNLPTILTGGNATINISKDDITPLDANDIDVNPFLEKQSTLSFIVSDGTETRTEKVTISQRHHKLIVRNMPTEVELGEEYVVRLASNVAWEAEVGDESIIQVTTSAGGANILGFDFKFTVSSLTTDEGKDVTITFKNPEGKFPPQIFQMKTFREYPNSYIVKPGDVLQLPVAKAFVVAQEVFAEQLEGAGTFTTELLWQDRLNDAKTEGLITQVSVPANATKSSFIKVVTNTGTMQDVLSPSMNASDNHTETIPMKGNAVVALKLDGVIVWSWHIWVTDYNPNEALDYAFKVGESDVKNVTGGKVVSFFNTVKSTVIMDRDMGGVSGNIESDLFKGVSYQWGRKDPMAGGTTNYLVGGAKVRPIYDMDRNVLTEQASSLVPATVTGLRKEVVSGTGSYLKRSIEEPLTMFTGIDINAHDWYSAEIDVVDNNLWNSLDNNKTYYDPCPKGWRVPLGGFGLDAVYYSLSGKGISDRNLNNQYYDYTEVGLGILPQDISRSVGSGGIAGGAHSSWHGANVAAFSYLNSVGPSIANVSYPTARGVAANVRCVKDIKNK